MAGTITALVVQKRNKERVNVYLDGKFAFGLAAIEAARLRKGQWLSDEDITALLARDAVEKAFQKALRFLSYRPRSEAEIRRHLEKHGVPAEAIEKAMERLRRAGLVDDAEFARFWIENREQFNPRSPRALRYELRQKGLSDEIIDEALAGFDAEDAAKRAALGQMRKWKGLDARSLRRKMWDFLMRRGFETGVIRDTIEALMSEWAEGNEEERLQQLDK